jgi:hypothetical protein
MAKPWPPTTPDSVTISIDQFDPNVATGEGIGVTIRPIDTNGLPGASGVLSRDPDIDGWYAGNIPGYRQAIGVREATDGSQKWWEARVGNELRPHKYLNRVSAQQGALAELARLKIAGKD